MSKGGVTLFRGAPSAAQAYLEKDTSRADDYYLGEGTGLASRWVLDGDGQVTGRSEMDSESYRVWVGWTDPVTGESWGIPREASEDGSRRGSPLFAEMTVNCDKTLSLAAALDSTVSAALDAAQEEAAHRMLEYLGQHSVTRVGPKGAQEFVAVEKLEAASVVHNTSRAGDPHRHIHLQVNTRVLARGKYRALDTAEMFRQQGALRGLCAAVINQHDGLAEALAQAGFTLNPSTGEVEELSEYKDAFSQRAAQVAGNKELLETQWREEHPGEEPGPRVVRSWDRLAWAMDRPQKAPDTMPNEDLWREDLALMGFEMPTGPVPLVGHGSVADLDRDALAAEAVLRVQAHRSTWSSADLSAAVADLVGESGIQVQPAVLVQTLEDITDRAVAECQSVAPGEWQDVLPLGYRHLTSTHVMQVEEELQARLAQFALDEDASTLSEAQVLDTVAAAEAALPETERAKHPLGAEQVAAVAAMSGTHRLVVVTGAAGAGKTTVLKAARQVCDVQNRDQVVLAPSKKAASVAGAEVGSPGRSVHALLYAYGYRWDENNQWSMIRQGDIDPATGTENRGVPRNQWLKEGTQIVVDEAGMLDQEAAVRLLKIAEFAKAQVVFMGDSAQLAAVGRGGVLDMAANHTRAHADLADVHRFDAMPGYATVSLDLRERENLGHAYRYYADHDLLRVHASADDARHAIAADYLKERANGVTSALTVPTNSEAAELNAAIRASLASGGQVAEAQMNGSDGLGIGVGDQIMTRRNDLELGVANRDVYTVVRAEAGLGIMVTDPEGHRHTLNADYVAKHVHLAYAVTGHGNQGVTTDTSHTLITEDTDAAGAYVGLTRGKQANVLHIVADDTTDGLDVFTQAFARENADRGLEAAHTDLEEQLAPYRVKLRTKPLTRNEVNDAALLRARYSKTAKTWMEYAQRQERIEKYRDNIAQRRQVHTDWKRQGRALPAELHQQAAEATQQADILTTQVKAAQAQRGKAIRLTALDLRSKAAWAETKLDEATFRHRRRARTELDEATATARSLAADVPVPEQWNDHDQSQTWVRNVIAHAQQPTADERGLLETAHQQRNLAEGLIAQAKQAQDELKALLPARAPKPTKGVPKSCQSTPSTELTQNARTVQDAITRLDPAKSSPDTVRAELAKHTAQINEEHQKQARRPQTHKTASPQRPQDISGPITGLNPGPRNDGWDRDI